MDKVSVDKERETKAPKTIEEILASSNKNKNNRSLFRQKNKPKSPVYIQQGKKETKASSSTRYGSLFGNAENRRRMFETKKKSLFVTTRKVTGNAKNKTAVAKDKEMEQEAAKESVKLPVRTRPIIVSKKAIAEKNIRKAETTELSETDNLDTKSITPSEPQTTEKIVEKVSKIPNLKSNSEINPVFVSSPSRHFITRPIFRYPEYPLNIPSLYNQHQPPPPDYGVLPRLIDYDYSSEPIHQDYEYSARPVHQDYVYNIGPVYPDYDFDFGPVHPHPVQFPEYGARELFPLVPVIDGYAKVDWVG